MLALELRVRLGGPVGALRNCISVVVAPEGSRRALGALCQLGWSTARQGLLLAAALGLIRCLRFSIFG